MSVEELVEQGNALHRATRYEEAIEAFERALEVDADDRRAIIGHNRAIRRYVPRWHFEMLHDDERADLYEKVIRDVVRPDRLVLDVGTGSGLLALMAARAGAGQVVACEAQPAVARAAERIVSGAGYADRVTVVPKMSTDMVVGVDLPRRADVLVTETVDCGLLGEGILATIVHAREHLLTKDAEIVPSRATVYAQLVESVTLHRKNHVGELYGFDLSEFNALSSIEYFDSRLRRHEHRLLSAPVRVFDFDFYRDMAGDQHTELVVAPTAAGTVHAIVFWFDLELIPGVSVTNSPEHPNSHWKQAVQTLPVPVRVQPGEPLTLAVRHDGFNIHFAVSAQSRDAGSDEVAVA